MYLSTPALDALKGVGTCLCAVSNYLKQNKSVMKNVRTVVQSTKLKSYWNNQETWTKSGIFFVCEGQSEAKHHGVILLKGS